MACLVWGCAVVIGSGGCCFCWFGGAVYCLVGVSVICVVWGGAVLLGLGGCCLAWLGKVQSVVEGKGVDLCGRRITKKIVFGVRFPALLVSV